MDKCTVELPSSLLQVLRACRTLPSAPAVVFEVLDLSRDPGIGTSKVAKVIARDPALTAKILKVANSPWCGVRSQVTTLDRAVNLLGINGALSLALSFSLVRELRKDGGTKFDHQSYWRRSVIAATATRVVGSAVQAATPDELFLAGLLQDIGMLALNEAMHEFYARLVACAQGGHAALAELERDMIQADHAQVGSWMLSEWGLPKLMVAAVAGSHDPERVAQHERLLARSVAVGSRIAEIWTHPDVRAAAASASEAATSLLSISTTRFERLLGEVASALPEVTMNLDIDLGSETDTDRLFDQAREAVAELSLKAQHETRQLEFQAQRDELTSLYNRTYLNQFLQRQFEVCLQLSHPLTVIFLDIDNFKCINDTYGHQGGDSVLVSVARAIKSATRSIDTVVRFGGDEFVVVLTDSSEDVAAMVAERIRTSIEDQSHEAGADLRIPVTVSVGCATMSSGERFSSGKELLEAADRSLYAAKNGGRNRVAYYERRMRLASPGVVS